MEHTAALPRPELLLVVDTVARDRGIDKEDVFKAMEQAIQKAGRCKYGLEHDIRADIDRSTGVISLKRCLEVVEEIENEWTQITVAKAQRKNPGAVAGDVISDALPPIDFGRVAAQTAKQVIVQHVRDAERQRQFNEYKERIGEVINGVVKRVEFGNIVVDLGRSEAMLRRDETIPRETFKISDRIRAYILDVREESRGPQIFLSRTHPEFMKKLFTQEVPEIYDNIISINAVARDPGSRAKIAVTSKDSSIDPVGACVGMRGSRVQAVVNELQGEKIDIIQWSPDPAAFIVNALAPAEVAKVVIDEETSRIEVVVPDEQLSLAIGRRGQNVRLASQLSGWRIDIMTEQEESDRRQDEMKTRSQAFIDTLDVDEIIANLLVTEGFTEVEEVAFVPAEEIAEIEGFGDEIASELQNRANNYLERQKQEFEQKCKDLEITEDLINFEGITIEMLVKLGENKVKTLDDFADLASDELIEIVGNDLTEDGANKLIMAARAHWFEDEEKEDEEKEAEEKETEEG